MKKATLILPLILLCVLSPRGAHAQFPMVYELLPDTTYGITDFSLASPVDWSSLKRAALPDSVPALSPLQANSLQLRARRQALHRIMLANPAEADVLAWRLTSPPRLHDTPDNSREFLIYDMPAGIDAGEMPVLIDDIRHINWLHSFDGGIQFSQAYLSPNWYQGGTNNISLLVNLLWEVKLNEVYHPNLLFTNSLSYKLGLYSTPQDQYHKYSISQDLLQWNMKAGLRARNNWFYSFTTQFKTQFLNNYGENSLERKAAFLSPGELNLGLGMTYSSANKKGSLKYAISLAPVSYNLKTCIDRHVDPTQFSIPAGAKAHSQIGSSAEMNVDWAFTENITLKSRLFLFTDYKDFQGDWENTFNFSINRFLSTQIYVHMRYDTSTGAQSGKWRYWMMKEILSFGFRYAFSTK